jgi:hypothetical protein
MDHKLFLSYIEEYTLDALEQSGDDVNLAADYLEKKRKVGLLQKDRAERNAALERVKNVFTSSRGRSLYIVLKSLGMDELAKEKL